MTAYQQATLIDAGDELLALIAQAEARGWRWLRSWRTDWHKNSAGIRPHPANPRWQDRVYHRFERLDRWYVQETLTDATLAAWVAQGCPLTGSNALPLGATA